MNIDNAKHFMLLAKQIASQSDCKRRQIGVIFRIGNLIYSGINNPTHPCPSCSREEGECAAIHAEVNALLKAERWASFPQTVMYVWAEIPCLACLSFIYKVTEGRCKEIHCLTVKSYADEYPKVADNIENISRRRGYAAQLGIEIVHHNRSEIIELEA